MGSHNNLVGKRFGRLTVVSDDGMRTRRRIIMWHCVCDCGNHKYVPTNYLISGDTQSCGCLFKEVAKRPTSLRHGDSIERGEHSRIYKTWAGMRKRCNNPSNPNYQNYGGRGISVCTEWDTYEVFRDWALNNGYDDTLTIDRINVNGNYEPSNCRWADAITQCNNRRTSRYITYNGESHTVTEWARIMGIDEDVISHRLKYGWTVSDALTTPVRPRRESSSEVEFNGECHSMAEWARITGIPYSTIVNRFRRGWSAEMALTIPVNKST